jgi:hypothetical protein
MLVAAFSEMPVNFLQSTWRNIQEDAVLPPTCVACNATGFSHCLNVGQAIDTHWVPARANTPKHTRYSLRSLAKYSQVPWGYLCDLLGPR